MLTRAAYLADLASDPELTAVDGRMVWRFPSGRTVPVVRGGDGDDDPEKKFTQADLDRLIADRLARAPKPPEDYQAIKDELAQLKMQGKSEADQLRVQLETAQQQISTLTGERDSAIGERDGARGDVAAERRKNAVIAEAAKAKAVDPGQVWMLLTDTQKNALTIGDDGQVTGADAAVKTLLEASPHLVGTPTRKQPDPAQGGNRGDVKTGRDAGVAEARKRFGDPAGQAS